MHLLPKFTSILPGSFANDSYDHFNHTPYGGELRTRFNDDVVRLDLKHDTLIIYYFSRKIVETDIFKQLFESLDSADKSYLIEYLIRIFKGKDDVDEWENLDNYIYNFNLKLKNMSISDIKSLLPIVFPLWKIAIENGLITYDYYWVRNVLDEEIPYYYNYSGSQHAIRKVTEQMRKFVNEYEQKNTIKVFNVCDIDPNIRTNLVLNMLKTDLSEVTTNEG